MEGFALLVAHLIGDYILQNDWQAKNKANPHPGPRPADGAKLPGGERVTPSGNPAELNDLLWQLRREEWWAGNVACFIHCTLYTASVTVFSMWWLPWWGLIVCWLAHWALDRYGLAKKWMTYVSGQKQFATGALAPWSVVVVDNTFHLLTLLLIAAAAGRLSH